MPKAAIKQTVKWIILLAALLAVGPAVAMLVAGLQGPAGGDETTLLWNTQMTEGLIAAVAVLAAMYVCGLAGGVLVDKENGGQAAGLIAIWAAMRTGNLGDLWRVTETGAGGVVGLLFLESLLLVAAAFPLVLWLQADRKNPIEVAKGIATTRAGLVSVAAAAVAALIVSFILVFTPLRGQALGGAIGGAIAGAVAARAAAVALGAPSDPRGAAAIGALVACLLAPAVAALRPGLGGLHDASLAGTLTGPAAIQPLDWIAAALIGAPIGVGWAASLFEQSEDEKPAAKTRRASA
ncbi:MAG: hypothetical protein AAGJ54_08225 [Planctomycetota bacterium]